MDSADAGWQSDRKSGSGEGGDGARADTSNESHGETLKTGKPRAALYMQVIATWVRSDATFSKLFQAERWMTGLRG